MKKCFIFLAVLLITANSFAWKGAFKTTCGVILNINHPNVNTVSEVTSYLSYINQLQCGVKPTKITFSVYE